MYVQGNILTKIYDLVFADAMTKLILFVEYCVHEDLTH